MAAADVHPAANGSAVATADAQEICNRYSNRLLAIAHARIGERLQRRVGAEDIVQSVFRTFFRRDQLGKFQIDESAALWQLLVRITLNKVRKQIQHHGRKKRATSLEVDSSLADGDAAHSPSEHDLVALDEEVQVVLSGCDEEEAEIFRRRIAGEGVQEIARRMRLSRWTVRRALNRLGGLLERRFLAH